MPTKLPIALIAAVILAIESSTIASGGQPVSLTEVETGTKQLASPLAKERAAGQAWLDKHYEEIFTQLTRAIEKGRADEQRRGAEAATLALSPWARCIAQGEQNKGQIALFRLCRPTERSVDHPQAARIRLATQRALGSVIDEGQRNVPVEGKLPGYPGYEDIRRLSALGKCLAEVADDAAADQVAALLKIETNRYRCAELIACLETIYGLPPAWRPGGMCGNSSPEEFRQFAISETASCQAAKNALLAWQELHRAEPLSKRIEAALDLWDKQLEGSEEFVHYSESGQWLSQTRYTSLIRLGKPSLEEMNRRKAAAKSVWHRGAYAIATAAITGEVDKPLVEGLLKRSLFEQMLACEIIAAAGSRDWMPQLTRLQATPGAPQRKASYTLAVVHRTDAIPALSKGSSDNFVATLAIKELTAWGE